MSGTKNTRLQLQCTIIIQFTEIQIKACFSPKQADTKSCGVIVMMAIYQIYIEGKHIKSFYNETNHTHFRELIFHTLYSVIDLIHQKIAEKVQNNKAKKPDLIQSDTNKPTTNEQQTK